MMPSPRGIRPTLRARRGFSFIELLVVLIFIGLIVRIAVPRFSDMKRRAIAAAIVGDIHTIRVAAYTYYTERSAWPAENGPGVVPNELVSYLPRNFSFDRTDYQYDYESWPLSAGAPGNPNQDAIIGLTVISNDPLLAQQVLKMAGRGYVPFAVGNKVTFFVSGVSGN